MHELRASGGRSKDQQEKKNNQEVLRETEAKSEVDALS